MSPTASPSGVLSAGGVSSVGSIVDAGLAATEPLRLGNTTLRPDLRVLEVRGRRIRPTRLEFDLLAALLAPPRRVWSFRELAIHVWGDMNLPPNRDTGRMRCSIQRLRRKLSDAGSDLRIISIRGYGFEVSVAREGS